jgi:hypothetical protein
MTPLENIFAQWQAMKARAERPELSDAECSEACNAANALMHEMLCIPAASAADLAKKIVAYSSDGDDEAGPDSGNGSDALWAEIRALAGVARAHVEPIKTD